MYFLKYFGSKIRVEKNNELKISKTSKLRNCIIRINGNNNVVEIKENTHLRQVEIEVVGNNCHLIIEKGTIIGKNSYLSVKEQGLKLILGENTMISRNAKIMTSDGHDIFFDEKKINKGESIIVEENVWIADNVTILKGVKIGKNAVLGINSTITKDVPESSIAAGNPAKIIKENIKWTKELTY